MRRRAVKGGKRLVTKSLAAILCAALALPLPVLAAPGDTIQTLTTPMELPIEVEIELSPAGSLKQAALWKELVQMLYDPYSPVVRRPSFTANPLPPLNVYPLDYNFLTAQPMRLRTSDGEVSWDQPGPMFDPAEAVAVDAFNTPTELRTPVGHLVACPDDPPYTAVEVPAGFCTGMPAGSLVVYNPGGSPLIPPNGTVVAVAAVVNGVLQELGGLTGTTTIETVDVEELEIPINEEDFLAGDTPAEKAVARQWAEVLGKALFWDMQVGSDGVQACGTCHFHAGVDSRTRNQLNPNHLGGDLDLEVFANRPNPGDPQNVNRSVVPSDFPFHKRINPDVAGDGTDPAIVVTDANDVMSSMGVVFRQFSDIPPIGPTGFIPGTDPPALKRDIGIAVADPIPLFQDRRRVEPRNTPTMHSAAFNLDNFWDGRARFVFNGGSVFGAADPFSHIWINHADGTLRPANNGHLRPDLRVEDPEIAEQPVRIKFSSLASQSVGPPLSEFEMSFLGRNWAKIGKKLLQTGVTPLANQLVATDDSRLGPYSNQNTTVGMPGLDTSTCVGAGIEPPTCNSYRALIQRAFRPEFWENTANRLVADPGAPVDPFDNLVLRRSLQPANPANRNQFNQMEANFSLFFGLAVQMYEELLIPDDTPADRFFDANPNAGHGIGEPGDQAVLFPTLVPDLMDDGLLNNSAGTSLTLIPDDPSTPEYDGFGPDELFGFDLFAGGNLTAALPAGTARNPLRTITTVDGESVQIAVGSNPFTRSAKCMLCHLGPEQTDHSINISHGLLKNDAEFEYPTPPYAIDPNCIFGVDPFVSELLGQEVCTVPAPEPSGSSKTVGGLILAEEVEETPQDAVEVEPRNFATFNDPATPWDDTVVAQPGNFAFGDQGVYNIGVRPVAEDIGRGGDDPFGWPLSLSALTLKNIGGQEFEPCDGPLDLCPMANFDPEDIGAEAGAPGQQGFEETGAGLAYPGAAGFTLQTVNPGFERTPITPLMPEYMVPWINGLPAGELHPQIDEMAGMVPNTLTPPNGGPGIEFPEIMFGADLHCGVYDPTVFGSGPPNFGWGALDPVSGEPVPGLCPQHQSGVAGNFSFPSQGTWPVPNRVLRDGAFKAPPLRNVEMTGPYFHTGSYLTLRQVVDFYFRGGDFPVSNAENRDPHIVELEEQAFAFGRTTGADLQEPVDFGFLVGTFADGLPDTVFLYDQYPDSDHPFTPEPVFASRAAALDDAKNSLVKFLLSLSDPRVKYERAPFDRPEIFVPINGAAPDNTNGRNTLLAHPMFMQVPAVGAGGNPTPLANFLGISSTPVPGPSNDHFDQ